MTDSLPPGLPDSPRAAVFLDRDGTVVDDPGFLRDPEAVRLLPGAAAAIARLNSAGIPAVIITNQSGIARGLITPAEYAAVERRIAEVLAAGGARIEATYHCPHHPEEDGPCDCRKPGTLLYRRAAADLGLDLGSSWGIGDRLSDLEPVRSLGGRAVLVRTGTGIEHQPAAIAAGFPVASDLGAAVDLVLRSLGTGRAP